MSLDRSRTNLPVVWTIAGSDPCGGAGIQADLKTFMSMGVHGCSVIAALTAQNSCSVEALESVSVPMLTAQIKTLADDMPPGAIKIGMLGNAESVKALVECLQSLTAYVVCDPVMVSSTGRPLITPDVIDLMKKILFPRVDLLTPNLAEAEAIVSKKIINDEDVEKAASSIRAFGVKAVVIKGWIGNCHYAQDYYDDGIQRFWVTSPMRQGQSARGTGCTFSSVHAAAHALGFSLADSAVIAKAYINQALRLSHAIGRGAPILSHYSLPCTPEDFPWMTISAREGCERPTYQDCGSSPLGFYPIVNSFSWLQRLLLLGVTTAQLRIKDGTYADIDEEIRQSVGLARIHGCRLFINDYWKSAIEHGAYGVHLGQEDLATADMKAIHNSGLRLGLSTHCYAEVARACSYNPSYIAIGPIFETTLKKMAFSPQGIDALATWRSLLKQPLVAIGGITLKSAPEILAQGADGIAVVSDVTQNVDPEGRARAWLDFFKHHQNASTSHIQTEIQPRSVKV